MTIRGLIIPYYNRPYLNRAPFDQTQEWKRLVQAAERLQGRLIVVMNPNCGDVGNLTSDERQRWRKEMDAFKAKGGKLLGYVHTCWHDQNSTPQPGCPNPCPRGPNLSALERDVMKDIDDWLDIFSDLDGIFFDEVSSDPTDTPYYANLYQHIQGRRPDSLVVFNQGSHKDLRYFTIGSGATTPAPIICFQENSSAGYDRWAFPNVHSAEQMARSLLLLHSLPAGKLEASLSRAQQEGYGWIYLTDAAWHNPLPGYFDRLVELVLSSPMPSICGSTVAGNTNWQFVNKTYYQHVFVDIDVSAGHFTQPPSFVFSVVGNINGEPSWAKLLGPGLITESRPSKVRVSFRSADFFWIYLPPNLWLNIHPHYINWIACGV